MSALSAGCLAAFAVYAYLGLLVLVLDRSARSNRIFFALSLLLSLWSLGYAVLQSTAAVGDFERVFRLTAPAFILVPACLLHLALRLTDAGWPDRRPALLVAAYLPAVAFTVVLWATDQLMPGLVRTPLGWCEETGFGSVVPAAFLAYYGVYGLAALLVVARWGVSSGDLRKRRQARTIVAGGAASLVLMLLEAFGWPGLAAGPVPTVSPLLMVFLIAAFGIALTRDRLMAMSPSAVARILLETMNDAVLLVGPDRVVLTANPAAEALLATPAGGLVGTRLSEWLAPAGPSGEDFVEGLGRSPRARAEISCRTRDGASIPVAASASRVEDASGEPLGVVLVLSDVRESKRHEAELRRLAHHDELTGLTNRPAFFERLNSALARARRAWRHVAILFLDLDDLKLLNDALGHEAGDALLREAARRIRAAVRASDTVSRLGGDEFGVVLEDVADTEEVDRVSGRIAEACAAPFTLADHSDSVRYSLGSAVFPRDGDSAEELFRSADQAMYAAKRRKGRRR